jgi:hypothetical protein
MNKQPDMPPSRTAPRASAFEAHLEQGPLINERAIAVPRATTPIESSRTFPAQKMVTPSSGSDVASPAKVASRSEESAVSEPAIETNFRHSDIRDVQAQPKQTVDRSPQTANDHLVSPHATTTRVASSVIRAPKELRPAAIPYLAQLREALQMPVADSDTTTSEPRPANHQEQTEMRAPSPRKLEPVEQKQPETLRVRVDETKDAVASRSRLTPVVPSVASRQEPKRAAAKRESRIHIGRVDVRLNNASVPVTQPPPAARPVAAISGLDTHFLSSFPIRV